MFSRVLYYTCPILYSIESNLESIRIKLIHDISLYQITGMVICKSRRNSVTIMLLNSFLYDSMMIIQMWTILRAFFIKLVQCSNHHLLNSSIAIYSFFQLRSLLLVEGLILVSNFSFKFQSNLCIASHLLLNSFPIVTSFQGWFSF